MATNIAMQEVQSRGAVPAPPIVNALSFDIEDYFQVQALAGVVDRASWSGRETRVERNTDLILQQLADANTKATFFVLGWIAARHAALVRRIVAQGHELASHGFAHFRVDQQTPDEFREDVHRTKECLEDCSGVEVCGYRAATFSIGPKESWAFPILEEEGYRYSSSIYPIRSDLHAYADAPRFAFRPGGTDNFWEYPISTVSLGKRNFPGGGGGYFRLLPYSVSRAAIRRINARDKKPAVFYLHPWELDPEQPRPPGVPLKSRLRHYLNLDRTEPRLRRLLSDFRWGTISSIWPVENDRRSG